ncbi:MAG: YigZ family protein [Anaerolineaceae bacterium]|jgi:uncharacterized YigZ family protein
MKSEKRLIPLEEVENEILVVNSRFIASLAPAKSVEEAREYIAGIKRRYPDATHNVPAFVIGHGKSLITHCSDDGEPSGTSGRPALAVLQGSGLGNVVVVVTRYFGGTKLGTGGLVKAYGDAVREILPLVKLAELVETVTLAFTIPYNLYELCVRLIESNNGNILDKVFAVEVDLLVQFKVENEDSFRTDLVELCKGQVEIVEIERNPESVFPVS